MKNLLLSLFFFSCVFFMSDTNAKDYKPYMCNYKVGVLENPNVGTQGDPCMTKGESAVKFYFKKYSYKDRDKCEDSIEAATSTPEMLRKYPANAWMIGCDKRW
jgi:hypothetical protein